MNLKFFTDRPVLSIVISAGIVLMGVLAAVGLPVEQFPDIAPPTISVFTNYPGANAETVQKAVVVPLEETINGVENMTYITSTANNSGDASLNIFFKQGTNADMAAVNVQNAVQTAMSLLPSEVSLIGVQTEKQQNAELKMIGLWSPGGTWDARFLNNFMKLNVEPRLKRVNGVGKVMQFGSDYSMRIWLDPSKMAAYNLVPSDISAVLAAQNIEAATGAFGENSGNVYQYTMKYRGRKSTPEEFEQLVVRSLPGGKVLRLKDVAHVELGDAEYTYTAGINGKEAAICILNQKTGTNASQAIKEVDEVLAEISRTMPKDMEFITLSDTNLFLQASIHQVIETLVVAILLVVLVVFVFVQDLRSTLIPTLSIFVSIIGTFAFMAVAGFSINLLTLFALVLAIGTVVDDAIVVVEAVQERFDRGYTSAYLATNDAMGAVSGAILISTLVFMAVFIPVSMMGGTSGEFYKQFGLTMAVAVGISCINSFTLAPALCALLLKPYMDEAGETKQNFAARFRRAFNAVFETLQRKYIKGVQLFVRQRWIAFGTLTVTIALLILLLKMTPSGFVSQEDMGTVFVSMTSRPGTSHQQCEKTVKEMDRQLSDIEGIESRSYVTGFSFSGSGSSTGMLVLTLKPWDERRGKGMSSTEITAKIEKVLADMADVNIFCMEPSMVPGYGMGSGIEFYLQDKVGVDVKDFKEICDKFTEALNQQPELAMVYSQFDVTFPQYWVDVDAAQCEQAGVSPGEVLETLAGYYGGMYASNFNRFSKIYRVMVQASPESRLTPESLNHIYTRVGDKMAPLSQFVKLTKTMGAEELTRFNLYNAISLNCMPAEGYSTGDAIRAIQETAEQVLPENYGYELGGISREESKSSDNTVAIFALCLVMIYLILCGLYESLLLPLCILLAVPCGLMGSFLFANLLGEENNIYLQTGIIMLIGLLSKTAILITDYATRLRNEGKPLAEAAIEAARVRLRPILMTALTMVFGMLPLLFASGVGAVGNRSLATGVVGGMLIGTLALLFLVPALFVVFRGLQERLFPQRQLASKAMGAIAVLACVSLSSCGTYKSYIRDLDVAQTDSLYRNAMPSDSASIADMGWREFFTDPYLQTLLEKGLRQNTDLQVALLRTEEAEAVLRSAKLAYLPSLTLGAEGNLSHYDSSTSRTYSIGPTASWEVDIFGKLTTEKRGALAALEGNRACAQAVQTRLVATIAQSYCTLLMLDRQTEIARQTLGMWEEQLHTLKALKRNGQSNEAAILQAEADKLELESSLLTLQNSIATTENALCALLAMPCGEVERGKLSDMKFPETLAVGIPCRLLASRPDVRQAEWALAEAYYATGVARASFYPSLVLSGSAGWTNNSGGIITNPGLWLLSAIGSLTQPLFNRGALKANLRMAQAKQEEAKLQFRQALLDAGKEVNDALADWQTEQAQIANAETRVAVLCEAVRKTQLMMLHSPTTYLEVLTARQSLLSAENAMSEHQMAKMQAAIALYHALGGGYYAENE